MPQLPGYNHFGGTHWESAALKNALAYSGVVAPHTGKPLSEAMCLGIAGGIAAGYSFCSSIPSWETKLGPPTDLKPDAPFEERYIRQFGCGSGVSIPCRHHAFSTGADKYDVPLKRLGCKTVINETGGAKAAQQHLADGLSAGRPVFIWMAALRLDGRRVGPCGMYTALCIGLDEEKGEAKLADRAPDAIAVPLDELAFLRNRVCSFKNRSLAFEPPKTLTPKALEKAVSEAVAACAADFAKPKLGTFNLPGLIDWSKTMASPKNKRGWWAVFGGNGDGRLYLPLRDVFDSIETAGTGGGLLRPLYAEFLDEAADVLKKPELKAAAKAYRSLAAQWTALAESCLPDAVKPFKQTKSLLRKRAALFAEKGSRADKQIESIGSELGAIERQIRKDFPLDAAKTKDLLESIAAKVAALHAAETEAAKLLAV